MDKRLSDLWWIQGQHYMPQAYTCPLLMTLSMWLKRLRGKHAYWCAAAQDKDGRWINPARVVVGNYEIGCSFPRWMILKECDFWNSRIGGGLRAPLTIMRFMD